jgi:hypothetical protein
MKNLTTLKRKVAKNLRSKELGKIMIRDNIKVKGSKKS